MTRLNVAKTPQIDGLVCHLVKKNSVIEAYRIDTAETRITIGCVLGFRLGSGLQTNVRLGVTGNCTLGVNDKIWRN
jgi:hypothetical protein